MKDTLLDDLHRIDPLPVETEPPPISALLERLDPAIRPPHAPLRGLRPRRRPQRHRIAFAAAALIGASLATTLALSELGGGGSLNVVAAAYRATMSGAGILHMSIVTERTVGSSTTTTSRQIWSAQDPRRMRTVQTDSEETREGTLTTEPVRAREWSSSQPTAIEESTPANVALSESTPVQIIHRLLGEGRATVLGATTYEGHEAWRLQIHPQAARGSTATAQPTLIVAAGTYVPLELVERFVTSENGKSLPTEQRERYTQYEQLPANARDEALLELAPHPGASVQREG